MRTTKATAFLETRAAALRAEIAERQRALEEVERLKRALEQATPKRVRRPTRTITSKADAAPAADNSPLAPTGA